ncbi:hypothetical protein AGMMS50284_5620 [Clostridia bacterium]|nr:hypothetical protein AGMMS50284_5620 [Clostridia bacterium]
MDKLLISGSGKAFITTAVINFVLSIISVIAGVTLLNMANSYAHYKNKDLFTIIAFAGFIGCVILLIQSCIALAKSRTKINVYESYIDGCAIEKNPFSAQNFKISYEQISNIDIIKPKAAVVIYTQYTKYTCHTFKDVEKVRETIFNILNSKNKIEQ